MHPTIDSDKDTQLSVDELHRAVEHAGVNLSKSEIGQLMAMISTDGNDTVSNAEFMKARSLKACSLIDQDFMMDNLSCVSVHPSSNHLVLMFLFSVKFFGEAGDDTGLSNQLEGKHQGTMQGRRVVGDERRFLPVINSARRSTVRTADAAISSSRPSLFVEKASPAMSPCSASPAMSPCTALRTTTASSRGKFLETLEDRIVAALPKLEREMKKMDYDLVGGMNRNELRKVCNRAGLDMSVNQADQLMVSFGKKMGSKITHSEFCAHFKRGTLDKSNDRSSNRQTSLKSPNNQTSMDRPPSRSQMSSYQHQLRMQVQTPPHPTIAIHPS
jgi:Ca2+-binding EF-hand superfamily protein